jgi:hypothetical protein
MARRLEELAGRRSDAVLLEEIAGDLSGGTAGRRDVEEQVRIPSGPPGPAFRPATSDS